MSEFISSYLKKKSLQFFYIRGDSRLSGVLKERLHNKLACLESGDDRDAKVI